MFVLGCVATSTNQKFFNLHCVNVVTSFPSFDNNIIVEATGCFNSYKLGALVWVAQSYWPRLANVLLLIQNQLFLFVFSTN